MRSYRGVKLDDAAYHWHSRIVKYNPFMPDEDMASQLALRDSYRRKLALQKTPAERVRDMARLQEEMWARLRSSPEGYAHFLRRNYKARAIAIPDSDAR
jgi:hypothetical protein